MFYPVNKSDHALFIQNYVDGEPQDIMLLVHLIPRDVGNLVHQVKYFIKLIAVVHNIKSYNYKQVRSFSTRVELNATHIHPFIPQHEYLRNRKFSS